MSTLRDLLKLIRVGNLVIMLVTLAVSFTCLTPLSFSEALLNPTFILLALAVVCTGAAGNCINDVYDMRIDMVNKPQTVIVGRSISKQQTLWLYALLTVLGIGCGICVSTNVALVVIASALLLCIYSAQLKQRVLLGNITVAALSALVLLMVKLVHTNVSSLLVGSYAVFAFTVSLMRELVKDVQDLKGDAEFGCRTFPIVFGIPATLRLMLLLCIALFVEVAVFVMGLSSYYQGTEPAIGSTLRGYMMVAVIVPLIYLVSLIRKAQTPADFDRMSKLLKLMMLTGLASMILLKF